MKQLIINADDFGFTPDVNAGILHAHREGVLTATTLMANGEAFEDAVCLWRQYPALDVGCHLVLVQGRSLVSGRPLPRNMEGVLLALAARKLDPYAEFRAQIERIQASGLRPSHLDTHKHTHILPVVFRAVIRLSKEFGIPFVRIPVPAESSNLLRRAYTAAAQKCGVRLTDHFSGFRLTGKLTEQTFETALDRLQEGVTEFMCHPGFLGPELQTAGTRLRESRLRELEALISPRIRAAIQRNDIKLSTFRALSSAARV